MHTNGTSARSYRDEIVIIVSAFFCLYFAISMVSFTPLDSSSLTVTMTPNKIRNWGGIFGAHFSSLLIYTFGLVAFVIPLPIIIICLGKICRHPPVVRQVRLTGGFLFLICCLVLLTKISPYVHFDKVPLPSSGIGGMYLTHWASHHLGEVGVWLLTFSLLAVSGALLVQQSLMHPLMMRLLLGVKSLKRSRQEIVQPLPTKVRIDPVVEEPTAEPPSELDEDLSLEEPDTHYRVHSNYTPPPVDLFRTSEMTLSSQQVRKEHQAIATVLKETFADFGITGDVVAIQPGPVVTVYEFEPDAGTKLAKINSLVDDIALAMKVDSIIMQPVRGKRAVGVQVPNVDREMVRLGDLLRSSEFTSARSPLTLALGKSIAGEPICADLTKMPHLLTAGATGSGKSVAINTLLCSVIMKASPLEVRMILVDPKMLELSVYEGIPHLLMPVITEPGRAAIALKWATQEMERRYRLMQLAKVRNIVGFNEYCVQYSEAELRASLGEDISPLPFILVVIDELADLMMTAPKEVESQIQRLAQKARASGIHLVLATQRPSVDIITGVIKANLPCRAAFQVVSKHDSRTILDQIGADKLLGNGDMLFQRPGSNRLERIQGAFVSDDEVVRIVEATKQSMTSEYDHAVMNWIDSEVARVTDSGERGMDSNEELDTKFEEAKQIAQSQGYISASYLQRQLKIGYNRAARIVEVMEMMGLVDKSDGAKPRKWLG